MKKSGASADGSDTAAAPPRTRRAHEAFVTRRRGAEPRPAREPAAEREPPKEYEPVALADSSDAATERPRTREADPRKAAVLRRLRSSRFARHLGLRLDHAEDGVSRVHLPAQLENTEHGPVEGGVVGTVCAAAGHCAAASVAPGVSVRLVEYKLSLLGAISGDLLAIGEVVRKDRTVVVARIEVVEDNDRVVAVALATYFLQQP